MEGCTDDDGNIYLGPISTAAFACAGMFLNPELFAEAGIEKFPETWEEFWDCCDRLQANGITPLGLHTEGNRLGADADCNSRGSTHGRRLCIYERASPRKLFQ